MGARPGSERPVCYLPLAFEPFLAALAAAFLGAGFLGLLELLPIVPSSYFGGNPTVAPGDDVVPPVPGATGLFAGFAFAAVVRPLPDGFVTSRGAGNGLDALVMGGSPLSIVSLLCGQLRRRFNFDLGRCLGRFHLGLQGDRRRRRWRWFVNHLERNRREDLLQLGRVRHVGDDLRDLMFVLRTISVAPRHHEL